MYLILILPSFLTNQNPTQLHKETDRVPADNEIQDRGVTSGKAFREKDTTGKACGDIHGRMYRILLSLSTKKDVFNLVLFMSLP
ncbi:MAG: hypothetical protein JRJ03_12155 [Deltaproteobacteria bacterium]|nr:hypothetical protein [Deltaproteobacteria bacterium]